MLARCVVFAQCRRGDRSCRKGSQKKEWSRIGKKRYKGQLKRKKSRISKKRKKSRVDKKLDERDCILKLR